MKKSMALFAAGGVIYPVLEILSRGKTDISMSLAGGVCLCLIDKVCHCKMRYQSLTAKCCVGSCIITGVEFLVGIVVNLVMKLDVWDYSSLPLNILGQVCLPFSLLWFFITVPALGVCRLFDHIKFLKSETSIRVLRQRSER